MMKSEELQPEEVQPEEVQLEEVQPEEVPPEPQLRDSALSQSLYGPRVSTRRGRPSMLESVVEQKEHDEEEAIPEEDQEDEPRRQFIKRLSQAATHDPSKLVQVNVEHLSYFVPVQRDAPTKQTVVNQSICYFTYEFFRRLCNLMRPSKDVKYLAKRPSDLFVPFEKKAILHDINLVLKPGQTYLVLGPPQSGKTTLLRAIAGRLPNLKSEITKKPKKKQPHLEGNIAYNRVSTQEEPKLCIPNVVSFVGQQDVHAPYLTVKETFDFASHCRTLAGTNAETGENLTIEGLGLEYAQDTFVGNAQVRGVSGGQRRRVTLGEMMQGQAPPVACADEISTGLDAAVTFDICQSIVNYSKTVKTTRIVSLLQPGPETFGLFDQVIVLSEGHLVYAGPIQDVVDYFAGLGYALPATVDVADFLQSVTTPDGALLFDPNHSEYDAHLTSQEFAQAFASSPYAETIAQQLAADSVYDWKPQDQVQVPDENKQEFRHSWYTSFKLNFRRHLLLWWRNKGFIIGKLFENIGMAAATGGILFGRGRIPDSLANFQYSDPWTESDAKDLQTLQEGVYSALFMTCLHILLGTTTSTPDDIDERPIHYKHADANFYHTTGFVVGRLLSTIPQRCIEIVAFGIPVYFMVGLDYSARSFFLFLAILLSYTFSLKVLYGIIAQIFPNKQNVLSFGTFFVLLFSLFGGFIVYPDVIPNYYKWFYWCNPMAWAFQGMLLTEFTSDKYDNIIPEIVPNGVLKPRGFPTDPAFIGYTFAFFIPYALLWAGVLSIVLKKVRIEPKRAGSRKELNATEDAPKNDFNLPFTPVDLTFQDLVYEVKASTGDETLRLLNNVSGVLQGGRMCALMGSSGAGKTTLMDVVSLRKTSGTITGDVRMNGFPQERVSFLRSSGYVEQFDVQQAELTVRETVAFSAQLRLSRDNEITSTDEGRRQFVDYVLEMMELTNIEHLQVGSYEEGGLSFEQRKRLAIAVELAASPSVIFLDEPTSGLDSRGALVIMRAMKRIADTGRTVCATIHQPSAAVFEMFDDLLLLKRGGEVVFFGELGEESCHLVDYFEERGAEPIKHGENPAAWMLRVCTREDDETDWKEQFEQSEQYRVMTDKLESIKESPDESKKIEYDQVFAASARTRMVLMIRRIFRIMARAPSYNLTRLMIAVFYAILLGSVFLDTDPSKGIPQNDVDGIVSTVFLGLIIIGVVSVSMAVPVMKQIRDVFYKHRASGMLSHNSVTVAVTIGELPYICLMTAIFAIVYYSLVDFFGDGVGRFWWFFLFFALNIATYTYFGQAFTCLVKDTETAGALVGALIGFNVFFSGLVVRPQYFVGPFLIGFWTSPGRYAYEGIIVTQFRGLTYDVIADPFSTFFYHQGCNRTTYEANITCTGTMEEYVNFYFGGKFREDHLGIDLGVLFFCLILARLLLWLSLWKFNYVNT